MKFYRRPYFWLVVMTVLVVSGAALPQSVLVAQLGGATDIDIAYSEAIDFPDQDGLTLRIFFTPKDANGRPVLKPPIRSAEVGMAVPEDGGPYEAKISEATGPITIILVLDASGSMGPHARAMQTAAKELIKSGPRDARYSILRFNERDRIEFLTDFTDDENLLNRAIDQVQPVNRAGTCLYDATFTAVERLAGAGTAIGRRAIIIFTDGVDEVLGGAPCSQRSLGDVVQLASNRAFRVPLYTIGFEARGERVDIEGLRAMANNTGGTFAIGSDLPSLFRDINIALQAQLVAEALVKPCQGEREATLRVLLDTGARLRPDTTFFNSPKEYCAKTPTPTQTLTPLPSAIAEISEPRLDPEKKEWIVSLFSIVSEELIKEYSFDLITEGGIGQGSFRVPAPIAGEVRVPIPDRLPAQTFTIRVRAYDERGVVLFTRDRQIRWEPTPTPSPTVTNTPLPICATLETIRYEDENTKEAIILKLGLSTPEQIAHLRVTIVEQRSTITRRDVEPIPVAPEIRISLENILADEFTINVFSMSSDGRALCVSTLPFTHTRQPTPTPSDTPTPTPRVAAVALVNVQVDRAKGAFIFTIEAVNEDLIKRYQFEFINEGGELVRQRTYDVPPYETVEVPIEGLIGGKYFVRLRGLDTESNPLTEFTAIEFIYAPPTPTPTLTLTPSLTPTPSNTPEPDDIIYKIGQIIRNEQSRPLFFGVVGVLAAGLMLTIFLLLRRPAKPATGTGFLAEMTGAVDISKLEGYVKQQGGSIPSKGSKAPAEAAATSAVAATGLDDRTSAVPHMMMPQATITVEASRDTASAGKVVVISHTPFTLGRKARDMNFGADDNVSRAHAEIIYENGIFYIQDDNSTHGTYVDEQRVPPGTRVPIYDQAAIRLGTTTLLRFNVQGEGGYGDPDRTSPEMPAYH